MCGTGGSAVSPPEGKDKGRTNKVLNNSIDEFRIFIFFKDIFSLEVLLVQRRTQTPGGESTTLSSLSPQCPKVPNDGACYEISCSKHNKPANLV